MEYCTALAFLKCNHAFSDLTIHTHVFMIPIHWAMGANCADMLKQVLELFHASDSLLQHWVAQALVLLEFLDSDFTALSYQLLYIDLQRDITTMHAFRPVLWL